MFPAPSPNSQALFTHLASGGATPSTLDFHRTAISAAAAKREQKPTSQQGQAQSQPQSQQQRDTQQQPQQAQQPQQPQQTPATSQPSEMRNGTATTIVKSEPKSSGPFDPHDNDAANGLFMLAQGAQSRNDTEPPKTFVTSSTSGVPSHGHPIKGQGANSSPPMSSRNAGSRGVSEGSNDSNESERAKPLIKGKPKKAAPPPTNGRRKAEEMPSKGPPHKRSKGSIGSINASMLEESDEDDDEMGENGHSKVKMTDEEKRKNFLERNRCV